MANVKRRKTVVSVYVREYEEVPPFCIHSFFIHFPLLLPPPAYVDGGGSGFRKKTLKNPEAETAFLPDPVRDREEKELREKLKQEWLEEQERIKSKS